MAANPPSGGSSPEAPSAAKIGSKRARENARYANKLDPNMRRNDNGSGITM